MSEPQADDDTETWRAIAQWQSQQLEAQAARLAALEARVVQQSDHAMEAADELLESVKRSTRWKQRVRALEAAGNDLRTRAGHTPGCPIPNQGRATFFDPPPACWCGYAAAVAAWWAAVEGVADDH